MQRAENTVIRAKGLSKIYLEGATEPRALQGVDLEVRAGELTLLMGPSGSGKTTLLSILGCILRASEGKLEVLGVIELLQRLARVHGRAVVIVTHDPRVLPFGDRIIHLEDGRILREERNPANDLNESSFFEAPAEGRVSRTNFRFRERGKAMKRYKYALFAAGVVVALSTAGLLRSRGREASSSAVKETAADSRLIAAPGRIEAVSEELRVSSQLSGRLKTVNVEEGDRVQRGQVLAEIQNDDYRARVWEAEAELAQREAELRRTVNGARTQERREAEASMESAEAVLNNAKTEAQRRRGLADRNVISRDQADRYERAYQVARAQCDQPAQHFSLIDADAREEDRAHAEAAVATAKAQLAEARAYLEKSYIRAPINGVILRKQRHAGESVSTQFDSPVVTMADDSVLRVRLDVDESDVSKLRVGQRADVTAEAYGDHQFWGSVIRVGRILGRKNVRTDEPSEHVDTKILETLVELDPGQRLPLGLRVDSYVERTGDK